MSQAQNPTHVYVPNLNSAQVFAGEEVLHPTHGYGDVRPTLGHRAPLDVRVHFPGRHAHVKVIRRDLLSVKRRIAW